MAKSAWGDWWDIYIRDRCVCVYCGYEGHSLLTWRQFEVDHLIPKQVGGSEIATNKVLACRYCNRIKGNYDPAGGAFATPASTLQRDMLISKAREHIDQRTTQVYGSAGEELRDFQLMISELREPAQGKSVPGTEGTG